MASRMSLYAHRPSSLAAVLNMMYCISDGRSIVDSALVYEVFVMQVDGSAIGGAE